MKFVQKVIARIKSFFSKTEAAAKRYGPVSIAAVEAFKKLWDGPLDDIAFSIAKMAIKGTADDILLDKLHAAITKYLPTALLNMKMINVVANIEDPNEQLKAIIEQFKISDDELQSKGFHDFCVLIMYAIADGKLTWSECILIAEEYYLTFVKPTEDGTATSPA